MNTPTPPEPPIPEDLPEDPEATYDPGLSSDLTANSVRNQFLETVVLGSEAVPGGRSRSRSSTSRGRRRQGSSVPAIGGPAPVPSPDLPRFLLNRKIGEGGFGEVWEAHQTSLSRPIAVKRLKHNSGTVDTGVFSGDLRQAEIRFRQEALTTAHLEHPNIVPVHDLGVDADGRPLLAMKLVNGREWRASLAEDFARLPVDEYLARHLLILISVTQAVAFAHSRGIIHRDLKPAQVMIGAFGEVVLMDWGLAMAWPLPNLTPAGSAAPAGAETPHSLSPSLAALSPLYHPLNPAGTVAYMAPEQTEETPANLGPWTDVWLLGAILYEILTGSPPYTGSSSAVTFRMAKEAYVMPPSERASKREVPRQLAALAMRAMARRPTERIPTAQAFLEAVQNYLTGADKRRESREFIDRAWDRFQTAGDDYGLLAECLNDLDRALILWPGNAAALELRERALAQYARAALLQNDLRLARVQAERLDSGPTRTALLEELAVRQEVRRIEKARYGDALRQAKADRERAEGLVRFMLDDLHLALKSIGRLDIIRTVTTHVHGYFDSLTDAEVTDQTLHNRSIAYMNIGDLLSDEGKKPEAQDAYFKARDLAHQLIERDPQNVSHQLNLADAHERCGRIHYFQGRADESHREHMKAFAIREELAGRFPLSSGKSGNGVASPPDAQTLRIHAARASSRHELGIVAWRRQNLDEALELQLGALDELRRLKAVAGPQDPRLPVRTTTGALSLDHAVAWVLSTLGNVYRDLGHLDQAVEVTREGLAMRAVLSEAQPANASRLEDLMWTRSNLALMLLLRGDLEESLALFSEDIELRRRLSVEDAENVVRLGALIFPLAAIGEIRFILGQVEEAERAVRECLDVSRTLLARDPTSVWAMGGYAIQASQLSEILLTRHRWADAAPLIQLGLARARQVIALAPHNATYQLALARTLTLYGRLICHEVATTSDGRSSPVPTAEAVACWNEAMHAVEGIKASGEQLSILDIKAQILHLLGRGEEAAPLLDRLRERRWMSPYLVRLMADIAEP